MSSHLHNFDSHKTNYFALGAIRDGSKFNFNSMEDCQTAKDSFLQILNKIKDSSRSKAYYLLVFPEGVKLDNAKFIQDDLVNKDFVLMEDKAQKETLVLSWQAAEVGGVDRGGVDDKPSAAELIKMKAAEMKKRRN